MSDDKKKFLRREAAKRMFAPEFRAITVTRKFDEHDEKAPTFAITPTGECASRVFVVGVMTTQDRREGAAGIYYTARVNDTTGDYRLSIGQYQPEALHQIAQINAPEFVAVIGKPNVYKTEDGNILTSIRAKRSWVDKATRDMWVLDTARATLDRIKRMETDDGEWVTEVKNLYNNPGMRQYHDAVMKAIDNTVAVQTHI
jgi:RPA family protein